MATARELLDQGVHLRWEYRFDDAIAVLEEAVRVAEQDTAPCQLQADCLSWLGLVHGLRAQDEASLRTASSLHERALLIEREIHGEQNARVAETLRLLGGTLARLGLRQDAFSALKRSADIAKALAIQNRSTLDALARLSDVAFDLGMYDLAVVAATDYLSLPLSDPLSPSEEMAGHMRAGRALLDGGKPAEAVLHFARSAEIASARGYERGISEMNEWLGKARTAAGI